MTILVVHQFYLAPGQPGGSRFNEMVRLWAQAGHRVIVIAGTVNYATGEVPSAYAGRWVTREIEHRGLVEVWRCHVPRSYARSYLGRMWAFLAFVASSITAVLRAGPPDVVIATSPPLVAAIPGWIAARWRIRRVPWVFEIRDLWPESAVTTGVLRSGSSIVRLLYGLERWACRSATVVNVLTPAFRDDLVQRGLAPAAKIVFVPNGADGTFHPGSRDNAVRQSFGWGTKMVALYAGAHGRANAIHQLIDAAEALRGRDDILIVTVGDGPERASCEERIRRSGLRNIAMLGPKPKDRMNDFINAADIGVAVLQNNPTFRTVYPNKVFDYMACARPVVIAIDGVARQLVCQDAAAGRFAEPENGAAIAAAIRDLVDDDEARSTLGTNGRRWVVANVTRESLSQRYLDIMTSLVAPHERNAHGRVVSDSVPPGGMYRRGLKRVVDLVVAAAALVVLSPIVCAAAALVAMRLGRPILFRHKRPGLGGRPFTLLKFRTLTDARDATGTLLPDDMRITRFGQWLRSTSLDELPQLLNVVKGDMSLVGPRPLLTQYLPRYTATQARRHDVRPGMTGLAQVSGRNAISWEDKFRLDVAYVDTFSLWLDVKIMGRTVWKILMRQGISQPGTATAGEFMGSR